LVLTSDVTYKTITLGWGLPGIGGLVLPM